MTTTNTAKKLCHLKHEPEIPDTDWKCPKCGDKEWVIEGPQDETVDCDGVHAGDYLRCYKCEHGEQARVFTRRWLKAKHLVQCPTCKGAGVVDGRRLGVRR